jgi:hypothetical protein
MLNWQFGTRNASNEQRTNFPLVTMKNAGETEEEKESDKAT